MAKKKIFGKDTTRIANNRNIHKSQYTFETKSTTEKRLSVENTTL